MSSRTGSRPTRKVRKGSGRTSSGGRWPDQRYSDGRKARLFPLVGPGIGEDGGGGTDIDVLPGRVVEGGGSRGIGDVGPNGSCREDQVKGPTHRDLTYGSRTGPRGLLIGDGLGRRAGGRRTGLPDFRLSRPGHAAGLWPAFLWRRESRG